MFKIDEIVHRLDEKIRAKNSRLSTKFDNGEVDDFDDCDPSLEIHLDGVDTGVSLQLGFGYILANRFVCENTDKAASLHLTSLENNDEDTAIEAAVAEALTNSCRDEYFEREGVTT
jgi:hypothetical protein